MKIGFFNIEPWQKEFVVEKLPRENLFFSSGLLNLANADKYKNLEVVSVFVNNPLPAKLLEKLPNLKLILARSTGYDHIDLEYCKKKGIKICYVPTYGENTVAEHTFALLLSLSRRIVESVERTRSGNFEYSGLRGFDLKDKIIGVVGSGNIGQHVIRIAKGFEMKVVVFDVVKDLKLASKLGFKYVPMDVLLRTSDVITVHVPYNKHTYHLIDAKALGMMKKGAILLNTSRGGVVDTDALVKVLRSGKLGGAGLDVLEGEGELKEELELLTRGDNNEFKIALENHLLLEMSNVLVTPHNAFNTKEALMRIFNVTINNYLSFRKGKKINTVSL